MKDAGGHGSDSNGTHAAAINALPTKGRNYGMLSDKFYHEAMPIANYTSQVQDMLAMWDGTHVHKPLSADETAHVNADYEKRGSWRGVADEIRRQRAGEP